MKCLFLTTVFFIISNYTPAQDLLFARQIVDTMTSSVMEGRGYVNDGDKKAAFYLASEFRKLKLDSLTRGYFQPFHFPVNTFPGNMQLKINNRIMIPGKDYLVDPSCSSGKGVFEIITVDSGPDSTTGDKVNQKFILIDKTIKGTVQGRNPVDEWIQDIRGGAGIILIEEKKLTWGVSTYQLPFPVIHLLRESLPEDPKKISMDIDAWLNGDHETQNVVGFIKGKEVPDSFLVFSAHYDHLGRMGKSTYFPGANDNASGTAMLLDLARHYAVPANRPKYSLAFISFAGEEAGLLGSLYYTKNPLVPISKIKFLVNMDLLGTGDDGMMVVNGDVYRTAFEILNMINNNNHYLKALGKRGKAKNSDHYYFSEMGVPCFFFYTLGGISAYHDIYDISKTLPFTDYMDVFRLITDFEKEISK